MTKKKSVYQLAGRILNVPLLMHVDAVNTLAGIINSNLHAEIEVPVEQAARTFIKQAASNSDSVIAVIPIRDVLANKANAFMEYYFGSTSYETIRAQFRAALADTSVKCIVFDVDSPGGECAGCFDLVDEIYESRSVKPIYAVVNEIAYSAAYALASAAEKIYIPSGGGVGSIGVISMHIDQSGWDQKLGLKYTAIFAGSHKNDFTPHEPLSDSARSIAQEGVNGTYDTFVNIVARNRKIKPEAVRATEAALYRGKSAISIGLADAVMPAAKAYDEISKKTTSRTGGNMKALIDKIKSFFTEAQASPEAINEAMAEIGFVPGPETTKQPVAIVGDAPDIEAIKTEASDTARKEARQVAADILDICTLAGLNTMAAGFIREGITLEQAREKVLTEKAKQSSDKNISSTVSATGTGEVNPLLEDAKQRAEKAAPHQK